MWRTLADTGINVEGGTSFFREGHRVVHVAVEDPAPAVAPLRGAGLLVADAQEVIAMTVEDRPGAAAEITEKLAEAGLSAYFMYLGTNTRIIIGVDDLAAGRAALGT